MVHFIKEKVSIISNVLFEKITIAARGC